MRYFILSKIYFSLKAGEEDSVFFVVHLWPRSLYTNRSQIDFSKQAFIKVGKHLPTMQALRTNFAFGPEHLSG
jgi:hypothetical protein